MADQRDEKTDPSLKRRLAGRPPTTPPGAIPARDDRRTPTDENPPLTVGGHFQWKNLPIWGKWVGGAVAAFILAVLPAIQQWRASKAEDAAKVAQARAEAADNRAAQAKGATEGTYQVVTKPVLEDHEARIRRLELAAARAERRPGRRAQAPIPVVVAPKPAPLPKDTNAASALLRAKTAPPPGPDAGQ